MLLYCLKGRKNTKSKNPKFVKTNNGRIMLLSNCACAVVKNQDFSKKKNNAVCGSKKSKFVKFRLN